MIQIKSTILLLFILTNIFIDYQKICAETPQVISELEKPTNIPTSKNITQSLSSFPEDIQPKVSDLLNNNPPFPKNTEFPKIRLNQPELNDTSEQQLGVADLETKQISSGTQKNFPLVVELEKQRQAPQGNAKYLMLPRIASKEKIHPFTTTLPLNGVTVSHLTEWELVGGSNFGDDQNAAFTLSGVVKLNHQIQESLTRDNVYTVEQKGSYLQSQTVLQSREVTFARKDPQTLFGMEMQMSLTGSCIFPGQSSEQICTYTPGLVVDRNSIDSQFLVPKRISQTTEMGEVVTPESLDAIKQPGFQRGANGQEIGLDLFFPNTGVMSEEGKTSEPFYTREEKIKKTPVGFYSKVRQVVRVNHKEAVLGRTVRGYGFIVNDDNTLVNSILQLGNLLLPDANPQLEGGKQPPNPNINKNLFLAANNTWLPPGSFTVYHAGIGHAKTPDKKAQNSGQIPNATFNSIWIGMSPIIERNYERIIRYEPIGQRKIVAEGGGEGGSGSNTSFMSVVDGQTYTSGPQANLQNFYTQVYLSQFTQDVNFVNGTRLIENTTYYPHISFSGNLTRSNDVFRYYAGLMTGETIKAYVGGDYTLNTSNGWSYSAGAIGYLNSDRDYYSQVFGSIAKRIPLSRTSNLIFSSRFNYAFDRPNQIGNFVVDSDANTLTLGARANFGRVSLGLTNYFGEILPHSSENRLIANLDVNFTDNFRLSGYYTPIDESSSRSRYGASAQLRLGKNYNSPTLSIGWSNNEYNVGRDSTITDNVFTVLFKIGEPSNPFRPAPPKKQQVKK
ncbi:MAG: hypothetical protein SAL70_03345 [Scytonema sp. PMC 1070.18]|nr:hypothetical protein [Scytonema sp. PMC 1070.18]